MPVEAFEIDPVVRRAMEAVEQAEINTEDGQEFDYGNVFRAEFIKLQIDLENFVINTGLLRKELQAEDVALKVSADFIAEKRHKLANRIEALGNMLAEKLKQHPEKKVKKGGYTCYLRHTESMSAFDEKKLIGVPDKYVKISYSLDKELINEDLKAGESKSKITGVIFIPRDSFVMR